MTVQEIKGLTPHEFAERYPFLQHRGWDTDKMEYYKDYWGPEDEAVKSGYQKAGDPVMEVYPDDFHGWNSLILCWAEKVREVFINNGDGKIPEDVFITDIKEKYGTLRISFNYGSYFKPPYEKIDDLTHMAEHLSKYCCYQCGHIGRSSNEKKLVSYRTGGWISYQCKKCAKKESWHNIKTYGIKNEYFKKWLHSNPHFNMYKDIFNQDFTRVSGDWFVGLSTYSNGKETFRKIDCHELIEGMF